MTKKEYRKMYYENNIERERAKGRAYRKLHLEEVRKYQREWARKYRKKNVEKLRKYHKERQHSLRQEWLEILNNRNLLICSRCGYNTCFFAIDFHHLDPSK